MEVEERIELLKANIRPLHQGLVELRRGRNSICLTRKPTASKHCSPRAWNRTAEERVLHAKAPRQRCHRLCRGNRQELSVRGHQRRSALPERCEEMPRVRSRCPIVLHDEVLGTFNVESPEPRAFTESDLQFLEIFTRDVAAASEHAWSCSLPRKASTAAASAEAIHSAVALPVDEILLDAVNVMEKYIGHEPEVVGRTSDGSCRTHAISSR